MHFNLVALAVFWLAAGIVSTVASVVLWQGALEHQDDTAFLAMVPTVVALISFLLAVKAVVSMCPKGLSQVVAVPVGEAVDYEAM